jgi:hypothetical protein
LKKFLKEISQRGGKDHRTGPRNRVIASINLSGNIEIAVVFGTA